MSPSQTAVFAIANDLETRDMWMCGNTLVRELTNGGFTSSAGTPYVEGARGVYKLIESTWHRLEGAGDVRGHHIVSSRFVKKDGYHAYNCGCQNPDGRCVPKSQVL
jgi:hypothetical protein